MSNPFLYAVLFVAAAMAIGLALRAGLRVFQVLHIPASVIAGVAAFAAMQAGKRFGATEPLVAAITSSLKEWPSWLIAIVFAGLLLEGSPAGGFNAALRRGARSGVLAWIIILGQIVIGLLVYLSLVRPRSPSVPPVFGQLLEVSWAGGHSASTAMGGVFKTLGFPDGLDLGLFLATIGLIYGVLSGLVLVNLAIRRGWVRPTGEAGVGLPVVSGLEARRNPQPVAYGRTRAEVMDPLVLQVVLVAFAFGIGFGLQQGFFRLAQLVLGADTTAGGEAVDFAMNVPLFLFTLLAGWVVREALARARLDDLIDPPSMQRLGGVAIEFLIVAAIATLRVESLKMFFVPVLAMVVLAGAWSAFCLLVLAPRLLPRRHWFELGLLNYGFSTANTPQGLMLLRIVDPELRSGAAEAYAVAAPLSAPFVGGGVITFVALPLALQQFGAAPIMFVLIAAIAVLYALGRAISNFADRE